MEARDKFSLRYHSFDTIFISFLWTEPAHGYNNNNIANNTTNSSSTNTLAQSYLPVTSGSSGAAAERKMTKYRQLAQSYAFIPVAVETLGPINNAGLELLSDLGRHISLVSNNHRESAFLIQYITHHFTSPVNLDFLSPFVPNLCIVLKQTNTFHIIDAILASLLRTSLLGCSYPPLSLTTLDVISIILSLHSTASTHPSKQSRWVVPITSHLARRWVVLEGLSAWLVVHAQVKVCSRETHSPSRASKTYGHNAFQIIHINTTVINSGRARTTQHRTHCGAALRL